MAGFFQDDGNHMTLWEWEGEDVSPWTSQTEGGNQLGSPDQLLPTTE